MTISEEHIKAASVCIAGRIPFSLVIKPGDDYSTFFATKSDGEAALNSERGRFKPGFFATFFGDSPSEAVYIPADLEAGEIIDPSFEGSCPPMPASEMTAVDQSTDFMKYCSSLRSLIGSLKKNRGKTVISRLIAISLALTDFTVGAAPPLLSLSTPHAGPVVFTVRVVRGVISAASSVWSFLL